MSFALWYGNPPHMLFGVLGPFRPDLGLQGEGTVFWLWDVDFEA